MINGKVKKTSTIKVPMAMMTNVLVQMPPGHKFSKTSSSRAIVRMTIRIEKVRAKMERRKKEGARVNVGWREGSGGEHTSFFSEEHVGQRSERGI